MSGGVAAATPRPTIAGLDGEWEGTLALGTAKVRLVVHVSTGPAGTIALMDSPDQLAYGVPLSALARDGDKVEFQQTSIGAAFCGTLSPDAKALSGTFNQGPVTAPIVFEWKRATKQAPRRPQTPAKPYPYREIEMVFEGAPGVRLAGTLTLPTGPGPFAAAVMITGSGAHDRDETIFDHKLFLVIADRLTREGIAVLRVDDRGVGGSIGDRVNATSADFADDTRAALAVLRGRPEIDTARIGLIGHSEGGMIGPMVAAEDCAVAFLVMLAPPGVPIHELMAAQREAVARAGGASPEQITQNEALMARLEASLAKAKDLDQAKAELSTILGAAGMSVQAAEVQIKALTSAWYRWFISFDPRPALRKVSCPVLAICGDKDTQVLSHQNLPAIRQALSANNDATVVEFAGLNHLFQTAVTGGPGEYSQIEETISPKALDFVAEWVAAHSRNVSSG